MVVKWIVSFFKSPKATSLIIVGLLAAGLKTYFSIKKSGRNEAESEMHTTETENRAKAEAQDVELLKEHKRRATDHENNIRNNNASPFIDDK